MSYKFAGNFTGQVRVVCFDLSDLIFTTLQTEANNGLQGLLQTYFIQLLETCQV